MAHRQNKNFSDSISHQEQRNNTKRKPQKPTQSIKVFKNDYKIISELQKAKKICYQQIFSTKCIKVIFSH